MSSSRIHLGIVVALMALAPVPGEGSWWPWGRGSCDHGPESFACVEFVSNHDGDTIKVNIPGVHDLLGKEIGVRLRGIDTGEMDAEAGSCERRKAEEAQRVLERFMRDGRAIELREAGRDKYFRIVADVVVDGESASEKLLRERLAVRYDGQRKPRVNWCRL